MPGLAAEEEALAQLEAGAALYAPGTAPRRGPPLESVTACISSIVKAASVTAVLPQVLARLAAVVHLDRLAIAEVAASGPAGPLPRICFDWQRNAGAELPPPAVWLDGSAAGAEPHDWLAALRRGHRVLATRRTAAEAGRERLEQLQAGALLMVPVMVDESYWGQILIQDCREARGWEAEELSVLTMLAEVIGAALTRERHIAALATARDEIALLARSDALTGLANRGTFADRLHQVFAAAQRGAHGFAVLYLDLDRFKPVNDTLGHRTGDLLLREVARRLREGIREIDLVARLGGDEFAIIQTEVTDSAAAATLAEKLLEQLCARYLIEGNVLHVGASIGVSLYVPEVAGPEELLAQADQALYRAKRAGRGCYRFYSEQLDHETRAQLALADSLRGALERGEMEVRYQPQVELASGRIVGMEALLRWNHPIRGLLLPEDFLPVAEKFGIILQLGHWVLDQACRQMARWRAEGVSVPVVAINVALAQLLAGRELVRDVSDCLERWSLQPADIELDVTELILSRSAQGHTGVLEELRRLGVGIAIDDFGAQYSSLDHVRSYRVSRLKLARGMLAAADVQPEGDAMIRAILSLARELGVAVVAEGVETPTQHRRLAQVSPTAQGQGFYYSQAVAAEEGTRLLRQGQLRSDPDAPR